MALWGMIPHLEVGLWNLRFWSLEINKVPGQVLLKSRHRPLTASTILLQECRGEVEAQRTAVTHQEPSDWWSRSKKPHATRTCASGHGEPWCGQCQPEKAVAQLGNKAHGEAGE